MTKSVRRNKTVDKGTIQQLYTDTQALYHLDSSSPSGGKADLGPLPGTAVALLATLAGVWVLILVYLTVKWLRRRQRGNASSPTRRG